MSLEPLLAFLLVLCRTAGFLAFAPVIGGRQVPRLVKVGLAMALASMWMAEGIGGADLQRLAGPADTGVHSLALAIAVGRETLLGAALGYLLGLFMAPARIAGVYLGHEAGLSMATLLDPNTNVSGNVMAELFDVLATMLFFALDAHHVLITALHAGLKAWPVGGALPPINGPAVADLVSSMHQAGMLAVLPAAGCLFVVMCGLLVLMRSAPQFSLFSIGQSLRVGVGLAATLLFLPHSLAVLAGALGRVRLVIGF